MNLGRRVAASIVVCLVLAWLNPTVTLACSPPFEEPTIRALGPAQVVVVGTTGERVAGGRAFHVERLFNGDMPRAGLLVIAFKEGEPVGDCSYPVAAGTRLIIAPYREADGRLSADLGTLQADPASDLGRRYLAEATTLFGPGVAPPAPPELVEAEPPWLGILGGLAFVLGVVVFAFRRQGWTLSDHE
jgi:hypothetical protein